MTFAEKLMIVSPGPIGVMVGTAISWLVLWRPWLKRLEGRNNG